MNRKAILWLAAIMLGSFALGAPLTSQAAEKTAKPAAEAKVKKAKTIAVAGKIDAVDKTAKTITLVAKDKKRVLLVTAESRFFKVGKPAVFDDATVGDTVSGRARVKADGKAELVKLTLGAKPGVKSKAKKVKPTPTAKPA